MSKKIKVVFLTESGYSPNGETLNHYLSEFSVFVRAETGEREITLLSFAGPSWNSYECVYDAIMESNDDLLIAVFTDDTYCRLLGSDKLEAAFAQAVAAGQSMSSWQVAMEAIEDMKT